MAWTLLHESALLQEEELSRQHLLRQELKQRQAGESPSPFFQTECFIRIRSMSSSVLVGSVETYHLFSYEGYECFFAGLELQFVTS